MIWRFTSAVIRLTRAAGYRKIYFPVIKEGHNIAALLDVSQSQPELIVGYDYRADSVELAREILPGASMGSCQGKGICLFRAASTCEVAELLGPQLAGGMDVAVMFHSLYWALDPLRELQCMRRLLRPGAAVLVGQQVVESTPGLVAVVAAMGAKHVFRSRDVDDLLKAAGYRRERVYLRSVPFYIAVWRA